MISWRSWAVRAAFVALCVRARGAEAALRKPVTLEIVFHVVRADRPVAAVEAFLDQRVARANEIFAPYGVAFVRKAFRELAIRYAVIEDRRGRNALAAEVSPRGSRVI